MDPITLVIGLLSFLSGTTIATIIFIFAEARQSQLNDERYAEWRRNVSKELEVVITRLTPQLSHSTEDLPSNVIKLVPSETSSETGE